MLAAIVAGWNIAEGEMFLLSVLVGALGLWAAAWLLGLRADALVGGVVLAGYLIGNRGFAQLHPPGIPLLPGETALGFGLALVAWQAVRTQTLPLRRDALNFAVLAWIAIGAARIPLDFRTFGVLALRDFATVYYALFFFVGQAWADLPAERRWLRGCLLVGLALAAPVFFVFDRNPDWFASELTLGGVPLIFVKSDVAGGFMAAGVFWFVHRFTRQPRIWDLAGAAVALTGVILCNNRAAIVALGAGALWLIVLWAKKMLRVLTLLLAAGLGGLCVQAIVTDRPFVSTPLYRIYESAASVTDTQGARIYLASDLDDKADNNQFRLVWWRAVIDETWETDRWFGLGFGHDLAAEFLRIYYADSNDDFSVRSPHNFLLTVFGRMGLIGSIGLLAVIAFMARKTFQAGRADRRDDDAESSLPLWLMAWTILASACFGVVLEGPMSAAVFWTALGLANGTPVITAEEEPNVATNSSVAASLEAPTVVS